MSSPGFLGVAAFVCAATIVGVVIGDGNLALALGPVAVTALLVVAWKVPLRWPLVVLTFLALTLENPADAPAQGQWRSPLYTFGALLLAHWNVTLPYKALFFSGLDLALIYLFVAEAFRSHPQSDSDRGAPPMALFAVVSLAGAAWMWIYGWVRGGADIASSLWQLQRIAYLPVLFFAFHRAFRVSDAALLAKVLLAAACTKACVAIYVRANVPPLPGESMLQYATTHADSMLFAGAACVIVGSFLERRSRTHALVALSILALLIGGMIANNRRLVWVELIAGVAVIFMLAPRTRTKRAIVAFALAASPIALVYSAIGWSSMAGFFAPVRTLRSVVDSSADASTSWRDWENYDLFYTVRQYPIFGSGYGHGYIEKVKLPDISSVYSLYRFIPHNGILGLWAYGGVVGFTALWTMFVAGVFFAARSHRFAKTDDDRAAASIAIALIVIYTAHCYGDMGLGSWIGVFTIAPSLALASKLAVRTGAWGAAAEARHASDAPRAPKVIQITSRVLPSEGLVKGESS